ncbi:hypothetical protein [Streptomyces californicus]|uniref:hypothetical protein n=1 Tax=Streptomyces californicus TaxID=67351 RepID=UPI003716C873
MKIRASNVAALVAASALTALAPSAAFAAPAAPPCTKENISYLDAQNSQEDAETKVSTAEQALDRARADRAKIDQTAAKGEAILAHLRNFDDDDNGDRAARAVAKEAYTLSKAAADYDPAATADAAAVLADAVDKALIDHQVSEGVAELTRKATADLRTLSEAARKATEAPHVEARQSELDKARTDQADAHSKVRPARDTYRTCLDSLD